MTARLVALASLALPLAAAPALDRNPLRAQLRDAIASGADYAGNVLLAGGFFDLRVGTSGQTVKVTHRDLGTAFGLRFLAAHYHDKFGD